MPEMRVGMVRDKLVSFKDCPRCGGTGQVPCDGKEHFRERYRQWAMSFNLQPVIFQHHSGKTITGLAVPKMLQGHWYCVKIYIGVTNIPHHYMDAGSDGYICYKQDDKGLLHSPFDIQGVGVRDFDIIGGKAFWFEICRSDSRDKLKLLDFWPETPCLEDRKLLAGSIILCKLPESSMK